MLRTPPVDGQ